MKKIVVVTTVMLFMFGCMMGQLTNLATEDEMKSIEKSRIFNKDYDAVWSATVKTLMEMGYSIISQDKNSGSISTNYKVTNVGADIFVAGERHKLNIFVDKKSTAQTEIAITPIFEIKASDKTDWELLTRIGETRATNTRLKSWLNVEKGIFEEIQRKL